MSILLSISIYIHIYLNITNSQNVFNELKHDNQFYMEFYPFFTESRVILAPLFTLTDALVDICANFVYTTFNQMYI